MWLLDLPIVQKALTGQVKLLAVKWQTGQLADGIFDVSWILEFLYPLSELFQE